jgi:hypothetical protein
MASDCPMTLRRAHFLIGWLGFAVFLVTGLYMRAGFPALYGSNEVVRYLYRANHIYVLLASLINVALGCYLYTGSGWRNVAARAGSVFLLSAPVVLVMAFFLEAPKGTPNRLLTGTGVFMVLLGILCHLPNRGSESDATGMQGRGKR